jgi:hypothetical protein
MDELTKTLAEALENSRYFLTPVMRRRFKDDEFYSEVCKSIRNALETLDIERSKICGDHHESDCGKPIQARPQYEATSQPDFLQPGR